MNKHSEKFLRKRKALLLLPLPVLLFVTLAFYALGGGKGKDSGTEQQQQKQGMNTSLPNAQLSGASLDKMSLYAQAAIDSQELKNKDGNDTFAGGDTTANKASDTTQQTITSGDGLKTYSDPNEAKVRSKLAQLEQTLNKPAPPAVSTTVPATSHDPALEEELHRLQQSMQQMNGGNSQDPEMQQMSGMLEKILDIQHPDRVQQQLREQSLKNRGRVYSVSKPDEQTGTSLLTGTSGAQGSLTFPAATGFNPGNGFYDAGESLNPDSIARPAIAAVVQETQTLTSGSTIKLRLTEDVMINGVLIPKNNFLFGSCSVEGERLKIAITGLRYRNSLFPVTLSVYDLDALEGIRIPGAISRDASKEGADRAIQSVQLMSLDPSIGAQAAGAGLEAAKGLFSKKVKLVRVTVKAGYPLLLMDDKAKQENNF